MTKITQTEAGGKDFLKNVLGEYQPLFEGTTFDTKYDKYWHDYTAAVLGESMADPGVQMLKKSIGGSTYGANAGETFFCGFTEDVTKINFGGVDGTDISFTKKDGKKALLFNSSEGVITYYYREPITPAKPKLTVAKAAGSKKITVKWNAAADADGYKVLVSTNKTFKKAKTVTVKANTSAKVKSLKKKTYFVKVCAYADGPDGKQSYGKYSNIKSVKVK